MDVATEVSQPRRGRSSKTADVPFARWCARKRWECIAWGLFPVYCALLVPIAVFVFHADISGAAVVLVFLGIYLVGGFVALIVRSAVIHLRSMMNIMELLNRGSQILTPPQIVVILYGNKPGMISPVSFACEELERHNYLMAMQTSDPDSDRDPVYETYYSIAPSGRLSGERG
jgi:hypothetical protein